jgi:hypothetical protein
MVRNSYDFLTIRKTLGDAAGAQETTMNYITVMWNKIIEQSKEIEALKAFAASINKDQYDNARASIERKNDPKNLQKSKTNGQQIKSMGSMLSDDAVAELLRSRGNGTQLNLENLNIKSITN